MIPARTMSRTVANGYANAKLRLNLYHSDDSLIDTVSSYF